MSEEIRIGEGEGRVRSTFECFESALFKTDGTSAAEDVAKVVAGMINSSGGELRLGVKADGSVVGVERDLEALGRDPGAVVVDGAHCSDVGFAYRGDASSYYVKLRKIVEAYLGEPALRYLGDLVCDGKIKPMAVVLPIAKAELGGYVEFSGKQGVLTEIYVRDLGVNRMLVGRDRDEFMKAKERERILAEKNLIPYLEKELRKSGQSLWQYIESKLKLESVAKPDDAGTGIPPPDSTEALEANVRAKFADSRKQDRLPQTDYVCHAETAGAFGKMLDEFEKVKDGKHLYTQLVIDNCTHPFCSLPYLERKGPPYRVYDRIPGVDFEIGDIRWLVRRIDLSPLELRMMRERTVCVAITKVAHNRARKLDDYLWTSALKKLSAAPFDVDRELMFNGLVLMRGYVSSKFAKAKTGVEPRYYRICGIRFRKHALRECPETIGERIGEYQIRHRHLLHSYAHIE